MSGPSRTVLPMRSEQARQLRRERKRLKREEKRLNFRPPPAGDTILLRALPSMGDTLVEYARPLINCLLPADHGPEELRAMLLFASIFWNGVLEEEDVEEAVPILARKLVGKLKMPLTEAFRMSEALARRRVQLFGHDPRIVANVEISRDGDRFRVTARSTVLAEDAARLRAGERPVRP